jgi:hypothetical protein
MGVTAMVLLPPAAGARAEVGLRVTEPVAAAWVRVKVLSPTKRVAERGETEGLGEAVQETVLAAVETVSQAGWPETVHEVKSAGMGVTAMVLLPPAAGARAEVGLRVTEPVAAAWVRVKVLSPTKRVAERGETEGLGEAVQETVLAAVETVSQAGWPETVHEVKSAGMGVTAMVLLPPAAGARAEVGLRVTEPVAAAWVRVKVLSPTKRVAERGETEGLGEAVQETVLAAVETVSQAGWPETVHEVKSAGMGVTAMVLLPPAAGARAEVGLRVTEPVAAAWVRVKVLSPTKRVAERGETEGLGRPSRKRCWRRWRL